MSRSFALAVDQITQSDMTGSYSCAEETIEMLCCWENHYYTKDSLGFSSLEVQYMYNPLSILYLSNRGTKRVTRFTHSIRESLVITTRKKIVKTLTTSSRDGDYRATMIFSRKQSKNSEKPLPEPGISFFESTPGCPIEQKWTRTPLRTPWLDVRSFHKLRVMWSLISLYAVL